MAFSMEQYEAICELIATGADQVSYGDGRTMKTRPLKDLLATKAMLEKELGITATCIRRTLVQFED